MMINCNDRVRHLFSWEKHMFIAGLRENDIKKKNISLKRIVLVWCLIGTAICFYTAGDFLVVNEKPEMADVIVVLSGEELARMDKAIFLYKKGFADTIILSNARHKRMLEIAEKEIPSNSIIKETSAASTIDNAKFTSELIEDFNFKKVIVISSDYHMRRVKINFDRVMKNKDITIKYVSSDSPYNHLHWWSSKHDVGITLNEYIKLIGNVFGIHGSEAKETLYHLDNYFFSD